MFRFDGSKPTQIARRTKRALVVAAVVGLVAAVTPYAPASLGPVAAEAVEVDPSVNRWGSAPIVCDGDTFDVDVEGDGDGPVRVQYVRLLVPAGGRVEISVDVGGQQGSVWYRDKIHNGWLSLETLAQGTDGDFVVRYPDTNATEPPFPVSSAFRVVRIRFQISTDDTMVGPATIETFGGSAAANAVCEQTRDRMNPIYDRLGDASESLGQAGDPVTTDSALGNLTEARTDITARPGSSLSFERFYNSADRRLGMFGMGWSSTAEASLGPIDGGDGDVVFRDPQGRTSVFEYSSPGWSRPPGVHADLSVEGSGYKLTWDGSGETWVFNEHDQIIEQRLASGEDLTYEWSTEDDPDERTATPPTVIITSSTGDSIELHDVPDQYTTGDAPNYQLFDGLISEVVTSSGRSVNYTYGDNQTGLPVLLSASVVHKDQSGGAEPTSVPGTEAYVYNGSTTNQATLGYDPDGMALTRVTDPSGRLVIRNFYDSEGRVVTQDFASGDQLTLTYDIVPSSMLGADVDTKVEYEDNNTTETLYHHYNDDGQLVGITDPASNSVKRTYSAAGRLSTFGSRSGAQYTTGFLGSRPISRTQDPDGEGSMPAATSQIEHDSDDRVRVEVDPTGTTTSYVYPTAITDPDDPRFWTPVEIRRCEEQDDSADAGEVPDPCPDEDAETSYTYYTLDADGLVTGVTEPPDQGSSSVETTLVYDDVTVAHTMSADSEVTGCGARQLCSVTVGGDTTEYTYDPLTGQVASVTQPDLQVTEYYYNPDGSLREVRDPLYDGTTHFARTMGYDATGRLLWMSDESNPDTDGPGGSHQPTVEYQYRADGQLEREIRWLDSSQACPETSDIPVSTAGICTVTVNRYDNAGNLVAVTEADDGDSTFGSGETNPDEATTSYTHGALGRLTKVTDPTGIETHLCYDADGNQVRSIVGTGAPSCTTAPGSGFETTGTAYDGLGRVTCEVDPTDTVTWNADGSPDCDGSGTVGETLYTYDAAGRTIQVVEANDTTAETVRTSAYNGLGQLESVGLDRDGGGTVDANTEIYEKRTYYPSGRLATVSTPPNDFVSWNWSSSNGCTSGLTCGWWAVSDSPLVTTYTYDTAGRVAGVEDPLGRDTTTTYTDNGQTETVTRSDGTALEYMVDFAYDDLGRQTHVTKPSPTGSGTVEQKRTYSPTGLLESETDFATDADGGSVPTRRFTYNDQGWMLSARDPELPANEAVTYGYDLRGNRVGRTSYREVSGTAYTQEWSYDRADRMISAQDADDNTTVYSYDYDAGSGVEAGRLWHTVDAAGYEATRTYTNAQLTGVLYEAPGETNITVGFDYDAAGRRTEMTDPTGTTTWGYDKAGNQITAELPAFSGDVLGHLWDINGNQRILTYPDGARRSYTHDDAGRVTATHLEDANTPGWWWPNAAIEYDDLDRVTEESMVGVFGEIGRRTYTFAGTGSLEGYLQCWEHAMGTCTGDPEAEVYEAALTWNPDGRVESVCADGTSDAACTTGLVEYAYDDAGQLTQATGACAYVTGAPSGTCTKTWAYDLQGNRTEHDNGPATVTYEYNAAGHLTSILEGTTTVTDYANDDAGRRTYEDHTAGADFDLDYDARGMLVLTENLSDSNLNMWREYDGEGTMTGFQQGSTVSAYVPAAWDTTLAVPQIVMAHTARSTFTSRRISVTGSHYAYDWADNTNQTLSPYGNSDQWTYDPYGEEINPPASYLNGGYSYRGELRIAHHLHLRARTYDPTTGTFLSPDPLDGVDGTPVVANATHYADNDPLNKADPLGLRPCDQTSCVLERAQYHDRYECVGETTMEHSDSLGRLYYHCGIYSVDSSDLFSPSLLGHRSSGTYREGAPVELGTVAVRASTYGGFGPEWTTQSSLLVHTNKHGPYLHSYTPYTPRLSGAIAIIDLIGLVAAADIVTAEAHSYRFITEPVFRDRMPPELAFRYHDDETLIFVQKRAERATCWGQTLVTVGPSPPAGYGDGPRQDCREVRLP